MRRKNKYKKDFMSKIKKEKYNELYSYFNMLSICYDMFIWFKNNEDDKIIFDYICNDMNQYEVLEMFDILMSKYRDNDLGKELDADNFKFLVKLYIREGMNE